MKILIVDDKKENRYFLESLLKGFGYEVIEAVNGKDAQEKLRSDSFNMIISDILMPEMDGFQFLRIVKDDNNLKTIPFVFYTATYTDDKDKEFGLKLGACEYIKKPIDPEEFIKIIQDIFKDCESSKLKPKKPTIEKKEEVLKLYSERLVQKLEHKMLELEREITKRNQTEKELTKLTTAVTQSPSLIAITDLKGDLEYVNPRFTELTGYTSKEVIGKNPRILKSGKHADEFYKELWNAISSGKEWRGEFHNKKKNGELFWQDASIFPIIDKQGKIINYIKVAEDITERKRTEQVQKVLYNISNAAITTDNLEKLIILIQKELGTIIDTNNFYIALYDPKTDMLSLPFIADEKDKFNSFPAGKTLTYYVIKSQKSLLANKEKLKELEQMGAIKSFGSDAEIWLGVPLKVEGEIKGVLVVQSYTDKNAYNKSDMEMLEFVSDQISISIDRKKAEDDLINALEKATESDRLKSAFLATMSHELRTPLNAIIGFSDFIDKELTIEEIIDFCKIINSSGNHLLTIVEDIFDITLIESGQTRIHKKEVSLHTILNDVHNIIKAEQLNTNKTNLDLSLKISPKSKDLIINTDPSKLKQILINLLKNAIRFTNDGHVHYGYSLKTDSEPGSAEQGRSTELKFYIEDTGVGIPKDQQELIFDVFRQVDDTRTRQHEGTGIGLSIAKKLVELLGGKIWFESVEDEGSIFYFIIPFEGHEIADKTIEAEIKIETQKKSELKNKTVLIVEDVESSFEFLKIVLEKPGIDTIWAIDGKKAIQYCKENPDIDLVLMDINMPEMNGYEATKEIKKTHPELPVIAQTAYAISGDKEKALEAGCDDYIAKPIKKNELYFLLEKYLKE